MADYKTPGVYVVEKDSFGSSIVANETAIPVFIGFTEKAVKSNGQPMNYMKGSDNVHEPFLVRSTLEYQNAFGGPDETGIIDVSTFIDEQGQRKYTSRIVKDVDGNVSDYTPGLIFPSLTNFFANGGGSCYIISIGNYDDFSLSNPSLVDSSMPFIFSAIEQAETTTLFAPVDLIRYGQDNYYKWGSQFVDYAGSGDQKKYFTVLDVIQSNPNDSVYNEQDVAAYRNGVGTTEPSFVASYFPYLKSLTSYAYDPSMSGVILNGFDLSTGDKVGVTFLGKVNKGNDLLMTYSYAERPISRKAPEVTMTEITTGDNAIVIDKNKFEVKFKSDATADDFNTLWTAIKSNHPAWEANFLKDPEAGITNDITQEGIWITRVAKLDIRQFPFTVKFKQLIVPGTDVVKSVACSLVIGTDAATTISYDADGFEITAKADQTAAQIVANFAGSAAFEIVATNPDDPTKITAIAERQVKVNPESPDNGQIEDTKAYLAVNYIPMPPSPYILGIYSKLDNATGVWTPPANVAPTGIRGPVVPITSKQQETLNVDAVSGKSINAIRAFTGKGTLVWGARTNNGNSMDWRYINVRRLFNSMERDISIALEAYVFKPNVHNTWVEVKTMIDSYLYGLYLQGAFAGTTPDTSYQVLIGLGSTMTAEDVLNGYMRVSIMVAPVRPAEFIELTFSQMVGQ